MTSTCYEGTTDGGVIDTHYFRSLVRITVVVIVGKRA